MAYTHVCIYIFMHYSPVRLWNGFPYNFSSDVLRSHNIHLSASLCMCVCLCVSACERISFVATTLGNCTTMAESRAAFGLSFTDVHIHIYVFTWGHIDDTWCVLAVAAPPANTSLAQFFGFTLYLYSTVFADKIPYMCRLVLLSYCAIAFTSLVCLCFARLLVHTRLFVCVCVPCLHFRLNCGFCNDAFICHHRPLSYCCCLLFIVVVAQLRLQVSADFTLALVYCLHSRNRWFSEVLSIVPPVGCELCCDCIAVKQKQKRQLLCCHQLML